MARNDFDSIYSDIQKDIERINRLTSNKIALIVKEIIEKHIQKDVFDYYDNIRAGRVANPYDRTGALMNSVKIQRGRGRASVYMDYDEEILDKITYGESSWKNSLIYREGIERDFFGQAIEEIDASLDGIILTEYSNYGVKLRKNM